MKLLRGLSTISFALLSAAASACSDESSATELDANLHDQVDATPSVEQRFDATPVTLDASVDAAPADLAKCTSTMTAASAGSFVELCSPGGSVEHVRLENVYTPATHASAQIFFGFDAAPSDAQAALAADQFKLMLYGGGAPAPGPMVQPVFGAVAETVAGDVSFVHEPSTVCFDLHDSTAETAPYFVLWVDGVNGADCHDFATLSVASAFSIHADWSGTLGAVAKDKKIFYRQAAGLAATPTITLFDDPVLPAPPPPEPPALSCVTSIDAAQGGQFVELCSFGASVEHVRIAGVVAPAVHASAQIFFGFDAAPAGAQAPLAADQWKLMLYGGGNGLPPIVEAYFGGATGPVGGDLAFVNQVSTVCFNLHDSTPTTAPKFVLWVDGKNGADCEDFATLTLATAFNVTDAWNGTVGVVAKDKKIFYRQAASATGSPVITLFDQPAL